MPTAAANQSYANPLHALWRGTSFLSNAETSSLKQKNNKRSAMLALTNFSEMAGSASSTAPTASDADCDESSGVTGASPAKVGRKLTQPAELVKGERLLQDTEANMKTLTWWSQLGSQLQPRRYSGRSKTRRRRCCRTNIINCIAKLVNLGRQC